MNNKQNCSKKFDKNESSFAAKQIQLTQCLLRDGNQSLRKPLNFAEKDQLFRLFALDGYKFIEIGFPTANDREFKSCQHLAALSLNPIVNPNSTGISVLTRSIKDDLARSWDAVKDGMKPEITMIYGVNPEQIEKVYKTTLSVMNEKVLHAIEYIKNLMQSNPKATVRVAFEHFFDVPPENISYIIGAIKSCIATGADSIVFANTVERTTPEYVAKILKKVVPEVRMFNPDVSIGIHLHNDKGRAMETALKAIKSGIDRFDVSTYGIGERQGGNLHAENFIRVAEDDYNIRTGINRETMYHAGEHLRFMLRKNEAPLKSPNETYSGIHVHGNSSILGLYDPVDPELLKISQREEFIFTSQSGGLRLWQILESFGHQPPADLNKTKKLTKIITNYVADIEDKGSTVPNNELIKYYRNLINNK